MFRSLLSGLCLQSQGQINYVHCRLVGQAAKAERFDLVLVQSNLDAKLLNQPYVEPQHQARLAECKIKLP